MMTWFNFLTNVLWILGLTTIVATLSWRLYAATLSPQAARGRRWHTACTLYVGFLWVTLGAAFGAGQAWWRTGLWALLSLIIAYQLRKACQGRSAPKDHAR